MRIYVEDDKGSVIFSTQVEVNGDLTVEPVPVGVAKLISVKRCLVAAAGIELGEEWWKEDE